MARQPVDNQRQAWRGQPQLELPSPIQATADRTVATFVSCSFVSEHVVDDRFTARERRRKHRRTAQTSARIGLRRAPCCGTPPHPHPLNGDHDSSSGTGFPHANRYRDPARAGRRGYGTAGIMLDAVPPTPGDARVGWSFNP
jgi:hypothetical protein